MKPITMAFVGLGAIAAAGVAIPVVSLITQPFRSAAGVASRTFDSGNMLRTYELFHDRWTGFEARVRQVQDTQRTMDGETIPGEKVRLRVELSAQRQSCRDIAAAYNADATKTNRSIFQGRDAPELLDMNRCG